VKGDPGELMAEAWRVVGTGVPLHLGTQISGSAPITWENPRRLTRQDSSPSGSGREENEKEPETP